MFAFDCVCLTFDIKSFIGVSVVFVAFFDEFQFGSFYEANF